MGAEIFATAGSHEKREFLRGQGICHVMDSRSLDFADEILEITNGAGVDGVLNQLAGDFITKSLSVLAPYGRFLEIGKVDILQVIREHHKRRYEEKNLWQKLNKGKEPPEFMSTHPSSDNRIKNLNEKMNEVILDYPPIITS